jgi:two-component system, NtrC family, sensor histidine kinase HydH
MLRAQNIEWSCERRGDPPAVSADEAKLTQVLINLIKNAAEAMTAGGNLRVRVETASERIVVAIEDTGGGIPEGIDVFEPFRTTKESGTGLGLPVARQILAAHQGSLDYRTEVGVGTTFLLTLPIAPAPDPAP